MNRYNLLTASGHKICLRTANPAELIDLRYRVLRAGLPREKAVFAGDELASSYHFGAFAQDEPPSVLCCATFHLKNYQQNAAWQLRGMATDPAWAGQGIGKALLQYAVETIVESSPVKLFWCNARVPAIPFYEKLGWKIVSDRFEIPTAGPHHQMVLETFVRSSQ